ncbi:MAG: right-handed parallel beta-helix repeat-containing protein, partial [Bacteroidota bacterium]
MKKIIFVVFTIMLQTHLFGQVQVQLGTGTLVTSSTTISPANIYFRSARSQMVYTAAELQAAGVSSGVVLQLGFYVVQSPIYAMPNYSVKMKHTTAVNAAVHDSGLLQEVYFNENYLPAAGGFDLLPLQVPFIWNGVDNILIDVCHDLVVPTWNASGTVRYYDAVNGYRSSRNDGQSYCQITTGSIQNLKPQILFEFLNDVANNVGVLSVDEPQNFCSGTQDVVTTIANFGTNIVDSVRVNWEFDGVLQPPVFYTTPIDTFSGLGTNTAQITLGNQSFTAGQTYPLTVWTALPNGVPDTINFNDTLNVTIAPGLAGAYTIGGINPDYNTFTDAIDDLSLWGVCGPVVFNVRNGTYNEQLLIPEIFGMDASNTVQFQSESGDSSQVQLTFSASSSENYTLLLDGADWFSFKNMTIEATNTTYGRVVALSNGAEHNRIENCALKGVNVPSTDSRYSIVFSSGNNAPDEYNVFKNNYLLYGSYGFYLFGNGQSLLERGNIIEGNRLDNTYFIGLFLNFQDAIQVMDNAIFIDPNFTTGRGIHANNCDNQTSIQRNQVFGASFGLRLENCDGTIANPILVANNFVQTVGTATGYGCFVINGAFQQYFYNSVQVFSTPPTSSAFFTSQGNNKIVKNNIFSNYAGGFAIHRSSTNGLSQCDFNNLYTTGPLLGFWNADISNLAAWQSASSLDVNSLSVDPLFLGVDTFALAQVALNGAATPLVEVTVDLEGDLRDASAPDIGADEFDPPMVDAGIVAILPPEVPFAAGDQDIFVRIKNFGSDTLTQLTLDWTYNDSTQASVGWLGSLASGDTLEVALGTINLSINQAHTFKAWTSNPNGAMDTYAINDTSLLEDLYAGLSGQYTIGGTDPDFVNFTEAAQNL